MPHFLLDADVTESFINVTACVTCCHLIAGPGQRVSVTVSVVAMDNVWQPALLDPILDFLSSVIRGGKAKTWFEGNNLTAVISAVFQYAQMTDEDVSIWSRLSSPDMLLTT